MTIKVGDQIPDVTLGRIGESGMEEVSTGDIFSSGKVALFGVPGAFTPTCSNQHLPGYVQQAEALRKKGITRIVCMSVNDAFVMKAWGAAQNVGSDVYMLPDGSAKFTKALGLDIDLTGNGMGVRCARFSLVAENGRVTHLFEEAPGESKVSLAENMLANL